MLCQCFQKLFSVLSSGVPFLRCRLRFPLWHREKKVVNSIWVLLDGCLRKLPPELVPDGNPVRFIQNILHRRILHRRADGCVTVCEVESHVTEVMVGHTHGYWWGNELHGVERALFSRFSSGMRFVVSETSVARSRIVSFLSPPRQDALVFFSQCSFSWLSSRKAWQVRALPGREKSKSGVWPP